ncbi:hypothetical protein RND71_024448 [Anisodus tanguticus]|uniref:Uncharacterized protein n=1 Tax=Anisodus tanguticus TaxID=243964 RepID=A0AAE1V4Y4_9SOLA|nr:hypothetical protein RND71_024448 [Anisodus tanguticus]
MGNQESALNDPPSDYYHHRPERVRNQIGSNLQYQPTNAEISVDSNYQAQVTSYAGGSDRANYQRNQRASYAGGSDRENYQRNQRASYAGGSDRESYQRNQQASYAEGSDRANYQRNQQASYAEGSDRANYQRNQQASYIADNYKSLDEVNFLIICSFFPDFYRVSQNISWWTMWGHQMAMNKKSQKERVSLTYLCRLAYDSSQVLKRSSNNSLRIRDDSHQVDK